MKIITDLREHALRKLMGPYYDGPPVSQQPKLSSHADSIFFGGEYIHPVAMDPHTLIVGCTGSGKTLCLRAMLRSGLLDSNGRLKAKALIYDGKGELLPLLGALGIPKEKIHILNPLFADATPWAVAEDLTSPSVIESCAAALFPEQRDSHPFFREAATAIVAAMIKTFARRGVKDWTLFHIFTALSHEATLEHLLLHGPPEVQTVHRRFLSEHNKTTADILATLTNGVSPYLIAAHLWEQATQPPISIKKWVTSDEPSVLVLSAQEESKKPLDAINRVLFHRVHVELLGLPDGDFLSPRFWLFLDEVHRAGKLDLPDLMTQCRSKGANVVISIQTIKAMRAVYGNDLADVIADMAGNKCGLRTNDHDSGEWLARRFGKYEDYVTSYSSSESVNAQGTSKQTGTSSNLQERFFAPGYMFQNFQPCSRETGLPGVFYVPGATAPWGRVIPASLVAEVAQTSARGDVLPLQDSDAQWSKKLSMRDLQILGLDEEFQKHNTP